MTVRWVRLELDLRTFAPPAPNAELAESGVRLATLTELGDNEQARYQVFELNRECSADIPERGTFHTWEEYRRLRHDVPSFVPHGVSLAVDGDEWVGMAGFTVHPKPEPDGGYLFSEMTGVVRRWRRRGLATALKVHNLRLAQSTGFHMIRTVQHPDNAAMIELNRRLGFVDASWKYPA